MTTASTDTHVFADTGAWFALADQSDGHHTDAVAVYSQLLQTGSLLTTNLVIAETYTLIRRAFAFDKHFLTAGFALIP